MTLLRLACDRSIRFTLGIILSVSECLGTNKGVEYSSIFVQIGKYSGILNTFIGIYNMVFTNGSSNADISGVFKILNYVGRLSGRV